MKITKDNYLSVAGAIDWKSLPKALSDSHSLVKTALEQNNQSWSFFEDPEMKQFLDVYFDKLTEYLKKNPLPEPPAKSDEKKEFVDRMKKAREAKKNEDVPKPAKTKQSSAKRGDNPKKLRRSGSTDPAQKPVKEAVPKENLPKLNKADSAYLSAKKVPHTSEEVKHIRTFLGLIKKTGGAKKEIIGAFESLAKAISKKLITKASPVADEIQEIQDTYVKVLNKGESPYVIRIPESKVAHYAAIAGGEKVYKTINIVVKFIGWTNDTKTEKDIKNLLSEIKNAKSKGKIKPGDPLAERVNEIQKILEKASQSQTFNANEYDLSGISGLAGILGCACEGVGGLGDLPNVATVPSSMSADEMMSLDYPTYSLTGDWAKLFGEIATNAKVMVWGEPGQGKSTFGYKLARYLASHLGKVLYLSSEEYPSFTMKKKIEMVGGAVPGWEFTRKLDKLSREHRFLIIDSVNDSGLTKEEFKALVEKRPDLLIILIFQATKDGKYKGGKDWEHDVDTVIQVESGMAKTTKNRFAQLTEIRLF